MTSAYFTLSMNSFDGLKAGMLCAGIVIDVFLAMFRATLRGAAASCQVGGALAVNAGGLNVLRYGNMREQTLGLEVVAEGVESRDVGCRLLALGCELAQGFGISKPLPADEVPGWIERWSMRDSWALLSAQEGAPLA